MVKQYKKKPVVISAVKWTGDNATEIAEFCGDKARIEFHHAFLYPPDLYIETLEGKMYANIDDYIIRGVKGEFYPCKPDIFEQTYEEAGE